MFLRRRLRGRGLVSRADESMVSLGGGAVVAMIIFFPFLSFQERAVWEGGTRRRKRGRLFVAAGDRKQGGPAMEREARDGC